MAGMELIEAGVQARKGKGEIPPEVDAFLRLLAEWTVEDGEATPHLSHPHPDPLPEGEEKRGMMGEGIKIKEM